jgi:hypothetical protein
MTKWPAPLIRLFLGQTTPQALLATADDPNAKTKQRKVCEVNFYSAELALHRHAKDEATRLFRLAATNCPRTSPSAQLRMPNSGTRRKSLNTLFPHFIEV